MSRAIARPSNRAAVARPVRPGVKRTRKVLRDGTVRIERAETDHRGVVRRSVTYLPHTCG